MNVWVSSFLTPMVLMVDCKTYIIIHTVLIIVHVHVSTLYVGLNSLFFYWNPIHGFSKATLFKNTLSRMVMGNCDQWLTFWRWRRRSWRGETWRPLPEQCRLPWQPETSPGCPQIQAGLRVVLGRWWVVGLSKKRGNG